MKTSSTLAFIFLFILNFAFGQSDKYQKAMEKSVAQYDTARSVASIQAALNQFERIASVEKSQWLPYYYAGMSAMRIASRDDKTKIDSWLDKADAYAAKADSLGGDRSEILVLKAVTALGRINVDFMARGPQYVGQAAQFLQQAQKLNPANPRVPLILGQIKLNTPENFGGDKAAGCQLVGQAAGMFEQTPKAGIEPHWGREDAQRILKKCGDVAGK